MGPIGIEGIILILLVLAFTVAPVIFIAGFVLWFTKKKNKEEDKE